MSGRLRLGVNIDHVATVRNARGDAHPVPLRAAELALDAGADGITAHLREDRRHIRDADIAALSELCRARIRPLNFEMAVTPEMVEIALATVPAPPAWSRSDARKSPPRAGWTWPETGPASRRRRRRSRTPAFASPCSSPRS